jgi:Peptidase family S49
MHYNMLGETGVFALTGHDAELDVTSTRSEVKTNVPMPPFPVPNTAYVPSMPGPLSQGQAPFDSSVPDSELPTIEPSLEKSDLGLLRTGASGLPMNSNDTRVTNAAMPHALFKDFVRTHRPDVDIERVSTGEHWYGLQALDLKLVDAVRTSDDYLRDASATADLYELTYIRKRRGLERILSPAVWDARALYGKLGARLKKCRGYIGAVCRA